MKICIVLGTRPEIIKMSPLIHLFEERKDDYFILHTGQHYSYEMDKLFFEELGLPPARYNLDVGSRTHAGMVAFLLEKIEQVYLKEKPDVTLVEGDTNSVLAGALAACKMGIKIGHVEAGLRSYDRTMPEEINRVLTDHISDFLFIPTESAHKIAQGEGIAEEKCFVVGNTIVDAVLRNKDIAGAKSRVLSHLGLEDGKYFLVTAHRQENVDNKTKFAGMLEGFRRVHEKYGLPVLYPIHPRARKMLSTFGLAVPDGVRLAEPVGYLDFLHLQSNATFILTDSGGVVEEACILRIPCVTLRENTERPETIDVGSNLLVGTDPDRIAKGVDLMINKPRTWENPYGDGTTAKKIRDILDQRLR